MGIWAERNARCSCSEEGEPAPIASPQKASVAGAWSKTSGGAQGYKESGAHKEPVLISHFKDVRIYPNADGQLLESFKPVSDTTGFCFEVVTLLCEKGTVEGLLQGCEMMAAQPGAGRGDGHVGGIRT